MGGWHRRRLCLPVVAWRSLAGDVPPLERIATALPLPHFLCITVPKNPQRADAECVDVHTARVFSVECGMDWARLYVPTHNHPGRHTRSTVRALAMGERLLARFTET